MGRPWSVIGTGRPAAVEFLGRVDAERGVDRGVEIGDRDRAIDDVLARSSVAPMTCPVRSPPPASTALKAVDWCPRPPAGVEFGGAAELGGDDDQGRVETADTLQVVEQGRESAVELGDQLVLPELALVVGVPAGAVEEVEVVRDLDEPDARLDQPPGQQAALAKLAAVSRAAGGRFAVELEARRTRAGEPRGLAAGRHVIGDRRIAGMRRPGNPREALRAAFRRVPRSAESRPAGSGRSGPDSVSVR